MQFDYRKNFIYYKNFFCRITNKCESRDKKIEKLVHKFA